MFLGMLAMLRVVAAAADKRVDPSKIHGRIQLGDFFPDFQMKAVKSFPDVKVKVGSPFGSWANGRSWTASRISPGHASRKMSSSHVRDAASVRRCGT